MNITCHIHQPSSPSNPRLVVAISAGVEYRQARPNPPFVNGYCVGARMDGSTETGCGSSSSSLAKHPKRQLQVVQSVTGLEPERWF